MNASTFNCPHCGELQSVAIETGFAEEPHRLRDFCRKCGRDFAVRDFIRWGLLRG